MISRTLSRLGLNEYEIRVYLELIKSGTIGAVKLSKRSDVPFGRIYDVLYQLESKGFVKVILAKPKKFAPIEPNIAIESALKKLKENYEDVEKEALKDKKQLELQYSAHEEKKPNVWIISGKKNIREVRRRLLSKVKKEFNAIVSKGISTGYDPVIERIARESNKRGVKRKFIEGKGTDKRKIKSKIKGGALVKRSNNKGFTLTVVDNDSVGIELKDRMLGRITVMIENKGFAKAMNEYFDYKWRKSRKIR